MPHVVATTERPVTTGMVERILERLPVASDRLMRNPWLDIPEADDVGHMTNPSVNQRPVLNRLLREALEKARPRAVLVLGCSTGSGLEHVDPAVTSRVAGVDLNPAFLQRLLELFPNPHFALDLTCADLSATPSNTKRSIWFTPGWK